MAIVAGDLLQDTGDLDPRLFPELDSGALSTRLTTYIADGTARATALSVVASDVDAYVRAWAYHRAYYGIALRLQAAPRTATIEGQGTRKTEQSQADGFFALAREWAEIASGVVPADADVTTPDERPSGTIANTYRW